MEVEWLILADSAYVVGNKLYMLGGGWDVLTVNKEFPVDQHCAVAVSIKVPWNQTNRKHSFEVEVTEEVPDSEKPKSLLKVGGQFEVGRPLGIPPGWDQRIQLAFDVNLRVNGPGTKIVIARIGEQEMKRIAFNVVPGPMLSLKTQKRGEGSAASG